MENTILCISGTTLRSVSRSRSGSRTSPTPTRSSSGGCSSRTCGSISRLCSSEETLPNSCQKRQRGESSLFQSSSESASFVYIFVITPSLLTFDSLNHWFLQILQDRQVLAEDHDARPRDPRRGELLRGRRGPQVHPAPPTGTAGALPEVAHGISREEETHVPQVLLRLGWVVRVGRSVLWRTVGMYDYGHT